MYIFFSLKINDDDFPQLTVLVYVCWGNMRKTDNLILSQRSAFHPTNNFISKLYT